ncbi:hypothetical protein SESBI_47648, partial [Sesbania bispinosa]
MSSQNKDNDSTSKGKEIRRGRTILKNVAKAKKENMKFEVGWNNKDQPIDPNKAKFASYLGLVAKTVVPITIDDWKITPQHIKDKVWNDVTVIFPYSIVTLIVGELARSFRKQLGKLVHDEEGNINDHPPPKYASIISMDEWTDFVSMRTCEEFQRLSEENRARASTYSHKYTKSRLGYAQLEQNMLREMGPNVTSVPRHELWRAGHLHNTSDIMDENVQQVWEKCALKAPEHPGRVRAIGYGVCKGDYFPRLPRKKEVRVDKFEFEAMKKEIIYLRDNPSYHLVGRGSVYNQLGDTLHNRPLPAEHVRVGVEIVLEGNAPLPVPNEDAGLIILDDALGAHHSTPSKDNEKDTRNTKESVASGKETDVQKPINLLGLSNKIPYRSFLVTYVKDAITHQWDVPMPKEIFNYEYTEMLSHAEISEIVNHEWLGSSTICLYIRMLYDLLLIPNMWMSRFSFINPAKISPENTQQCQYIGQTFIDRNQPNMLFLAPYNTG